MTANCTAAYVYRKIAEDPRRLPTLLLDEADTHLSAGGPEHEALRGIINAGYRQGVGAGRADGRKHGPVEYPTFCPAAMAGIGDLPGTIMDRSVVIRLQRRTVTEVVTPFFHHRDGPRLDGLGAGLRQWTADARRVIKSADPFPPAELVALSDRACDTWRPLFMIAQAAGGPWPAAAAEAAVTLTSEALEAEEPSLPVVALADCRRAFADRNQLTTAELIGRLVNDEESPWVGRTWAAAGETVLTPRMLAFLLRGFGPRPVNIRHHGDQAKGYRRVDFADAWSRYLPPPPGSAICIVCTEPCDSGLNPHPPCVESPTVKDTSS